MRHVLLSIVIDLPDVLFLPISGLIGTNLKTRMGKSICPWWDGPCLFEALDAIEIPLRDPKAPFRYGVLELFTVTLPYPSSKSICMCM